MNCRKLFLLLLILSLSTITFMKVTAQNGNSMLPPPVTEKKPKITEINGDRLVDNYFWLREKSNPAVISHLEAENAYTEATMKPTGPLQAKLYNEISVTSNRPTRTFPIVGVIIFTTRGQKKVCSIRSFVASIRHSPPRNRLFSM